MARAAKTPKSVGSISRTVEFSDGSTEQIKYLMRNDLRLLASLMGVDGSKERTNIELRTAIESKLDRTGDWVNPGFKESTPTPLPKSWAEDGPTPNCPKCGTPMVERHRRDNADAKFWACPRFPKCTGTRPMEPRPTPTPSEPFPNPDTDEYPHTLYCPTGKHPSVVVNSESDKRWASQCGICGADMVTESPTPEPVPADNVYVTELEAEIIKLMERAESAEAILRAMEPVPNDDAPPAHESLPMVVSALRAGVDAVYLYGPPGTGKSEIARSVAEQLELPLIPFACHPLMTESKLFGYQDANGNYHASGLRTAVEFGGIYLLDEIDNGNPSLIAALNSLISNSFIAFPDEIIEKHADFKLIATANTWGTGPTAEFMGRNGLDRATLDRVTRITVGIDHKLETALVRRIINEESADSILEAVREVRNRVEVQGLRILVSPRMSLQTAKLMHAGWTLKDALLTTSLAAVDEATRSQLLSGIEGVN